MSHPYQYHNFVLREIPRDPTQMLILDAGSGLGIWGYLLRAVRRQSVRLIGIDLEWQYLSFVRARKIYDDLVHGHLAQLPFRAKSFDFVLAIEVIEHLPKVSGHLLLAELSRCCRRKVILTTPNGFLPQHVDGVPSETHNSGWTVRELRSAGFQVRGIGSRAVPLDYENLILSSVFHYIGTPIAQAFPALGEWLIAVKTFDEPYGPAKPRTTG